MKYQFGWCGKVDEAGYLASIGYDFIELPLNQFGLEDPLTRSESLAKALASELPVYACNLFLPGDLRIVGPEVNQDRVRRYISLAAETLAQLKTKILVLGSAGARNKPEEWEVAQAEEQLLEMLSWCADELQGTGMTLAIEPLNQEESNMINTVSEAVTYAKRVNRDEVQVLADYFHMAMEQESLDALRVHRAWLAHVHLADTNRHYPGSGQYDYDALVQTLDEIGYDKLISVECFPSGRMERTAEMKAAKRFIDRKWGQPKS